MYGDRYRTRQARRRKESRRRFVRALLWPFTVAPAAFGKDARRHGEDYDRALIRVWVCSITGFACFVGAFIAALNGTQLNGETASVPLLWSAGLCYVTGLFCAHEALGYD